MKTGRFPACPAGAPADPGLRRRAPPWPARCGRGGAVLPADLPLPDAPEPGPVVLRRGGSIRCPRTSFCGGGPPARGVYGGEDWSVPRLLEITERAVDSGGRARGDTDPVRPARAGACQRPGQPVGLAAGGGSQFYSGCFLPVLQAALRPGGPASDSAYNRQRAERAERMAQFRGRPWRRYTPRS